MSEADIKKEPNPQKRFARFLKKFLAVVPQRQAALRTIAFQFAQDCAMKKKELEKAASVASSGLSKTPPPPPSTGAAAAAAAAAAGGGGAAASVGTAAFAATTGLFGFSSSFGFAETKPQPQQQQESDANHARASGGVKGRGGAIGKSLLEAALEVLYEKAMADIRQCVGVAFYAHVVDGSGGSPQPKKKRPETRVSSSSSATRPKEWKDDVEVVAADASPSRTKEKHSGGGRPALPQKRPPPPPLPRPATERAASTSEPLLSPSKRMRPEPPGGGNECISTAAVPSGDTEAAVSIDAQSGAAVAIANAAASSKTSGTNEEEDDDDADGGVFEGDDDDGGDDDGDDDSVAVVKVKGRGAGAVLEVVDESHNDFFIARAVKKPPRDAVRSQVVGDRLMCPETLQRRIQDAETQMNADYVSSRYASAEAALSALLLGVSEAVADENGTRRRCTPVAEAGRSAGEETTTTTTNCSGRPALEFEIGSTATASQLKRFSRMNQPFDRAEWLVPFRHCSKLRKLTRSGGRRELLEFQLSRGRENCATLLNLALQTFVTDVVECAVNFSRSCAASCAAASGGGCLTSRSRSESSSAAASENEPREHQVTTEQLVASLREQRVYCRHRVVGDLVSAAHISSRCSSQICDSGVSEHATSVDSSSVSSSEGNSDEGEDRRRCPRRASQGEVHAPKRAARRDIDAQQAKNVLLQQGNKCSGPQGRVLPSQLSLARHVPHQGTLVAPSPRIVHIAGGELSPTLLGLSPPTSLNIGSPSSPDNNALVAFLAESPTAATSIDSSCLDTPRL